MIFDLFTLTSPFDFAEDDGAPPAASSSSEDSEVAPVESTSFLQKADTQTRS